MLTVPPDFRGAFSQSACSHLGQRPSAAFAKQGGSSPELHTSRIGLFPAAVLGNAHVIRGNAGHCAALVQNLARRKAGLDLHPQGLGFLGQPTGHLTALAQHTCARLSMCLCWLRPTEQQS